MRGKDRDNTGRKRFTALAQKLYTQKIKLVTGASFSVIIVRKLTQRILSCVQLLGKSMATKFLSRWR